MAQYQNSVNGSVRVSSALLGYPWVEVGSEPRTVIASPTADAIMLAVGADPDAARHELAAEQERETPRKTLIAKLEKVIRDADIS